MQKKIVLSTDIGSDIDDALALQIAMQHPDIKLLGVYTTNGDLTTRAKIAKAMVDLGNSDAIVAMGEAEALQGHPKAYITGHEEEIILPEYKVKTLEELKIETNGIEDLARVMQETNPVIASIAPLTNISRVLERNPSLDSNNTTVYAMGGRLNNPEHNFRHDVESAQRVLDSNLEVVLVTADVCGKYRRPLEEFEGAQTASSKYINEMLEHWNTFNTWKGFIQSGASVDYPRMQGQGARFPKYFTNLIETIKDPLFVRGHPEEYAKAFDSFIGVLREHSQEPFYADIAEKVTANLPKDVAVHDAYVIYSIAHPDRIKTKKANVTLGANGEMYLEEGKRHTIVTDLDYDHFKSFLKEYSK